MSKSEGIRGMFRGNWTNCVRIIPNSAVKFLTYEQLCRCGSQPRPVIYCFDLKWAGPSHSEFQHVDDSSDSHRDNSNVACRHLMCACDCVRRRISHNLIENGGDGQMTPLLRLAAGAGAGIVGMSATYPLDMVRGRLTVQSMEGVHRYRGIMHATAIIVKEASPCCQQG